MHNTSKYIVWEPFLLALVMVVGMAIGQKMSSGTDKGSFKAKEVGEVEEILRFIESKYVDSVDRKDLNKVAIDAILSYLDPHSKYIPPQEVVSIREEMQGKYFGVGIQWIRNDEGQWIVADVKEESPAEKAEVKVGYTLDSIDLIKVDTNALQNHDFTELFRGELGSEVSMVFFDGQKNSVKFNMKRDEISIPSVDLSVTMNDSIGVIRINRFSEQTYREFMEGLEELMGEGAQDLIIDVRANPGGYLQETVKIISQFIGDSDELLVYTEGLNSKRNNYTSNGRIFHKVDDVVILIDENSASASEILAGSMQDLDRGMVVGRRSFGKGLVQEQYNLINGGAVRLTTARYFTPSGRLIQKDYDDPNVYNSDLNNRYLNGEWTDFPEYPLTDSTEYFTKMGRLVYAGGGISPDIFVADNNPFSFADWPLVNDGIRKFTINNYWGLKASISQDWDQFLAEWEPEETQLEYLMQYLLDKWPLATYDTIEYQEFLKLYLKAYLGEFAFGTKEHYYLVLYENDPALERAMKLISTNEVDAYLGAQ